MGYWVTLRIYGIKNVYIEADTANEAMDIAESNCEMDIDSYDGVEAVFAEDDKGNTWVPTLGKL